MIEKPDGNCKTESDTGDTCTIKKHITENKTLSKLRQGSEHPQNMKTDTRHLSIIPAYDHPQETAALFSEYTDMLVAGDSSFRKYLAIQHYDEELAHLETKYGLPGGRLYLAYCDGEPAGCIGLRKIDDKNCEMKRLYVRPQFRGQQIGNQLIQKIIADAVEIGYSHMLLDTLPFLESALHMYRKFGFYEIESYNDSPMSSSIFMRLDL